MYMCMYKIVSSLSVVHPWTKIYFIGSVNFKFHESDTETVVHFLSFGSNFIEMVSG